MRPGLDQMLKDATRRKFDVVPWPGAPIVSAARLTGVDLFLHQQAVDTAAPAVKAMFQMLGVFSEFERSMIQSRVKAGMARIKAGAPTKSGKPVGRPTISPAVERAIRSI
jgi:DNA invertase Pin-like site-specific DNA recombinase